MKRIFNFDRDHNDRIAIAGSGHPRCNYCHTTSHPRVSCSIRQIDLRNNIDRAIHPQKGLLSNEFYCNNNLEDAKWLAQATSSAFDPASIITRWRHTTQHHKPTPSDQRPDTPNTSSIVKPTDIGIRRPANTTTTWLDEFGTNQKIPYTFYQ